MILFIRNSTILLLALFLIYSLSKNILDYQKKIDFYQGYKDELESAKKENRELESKILKSKDVYTVEKNIRNRLNLSKPGEVVVIMPKITITPTPTPAPPKAPHQAWIELFVPR